MKGAMVHANAMNTNDLSITTLPRNRNCIVRLATLAHP